METPKKKRDEKRAFICEGCGFRSLRWLGKCPECGSWDSFIEEVPREKDTSHNFQNVPLKLSEIDATKEFERYLTEISEFDRVLGGGVVPGSLCLFGGEPGIGKSTLLLQALSSLSKKGLKVLYCSGEESATQIKLRAKRLGVDEDIFVICQPNIEALMSEILKMAPDCLAIDSIQTMYSPEIGSLPGSIGQIRAVTARLMEVSKGLSIPVFIIGHVTKEGSIAGPKALEHLVDTVLYLEGDRTQAFRILRTVKNRFGPTHEIGVFEMRDKGLREVKNPSNLFMADRKKLVSGSVLVPCLEGTRPILIEIQTLVNHSFLAMPRRTTSGVDANRLALLIAVSEKVLGITLYDKDIFVNVVGGFKIVETASDLPLICAILSSLKEQPISHDTAIFGEVGLTGEIRSISNCQIRINEIKRMGLKRCILPSSGLKGLKIPKGLEVIPIEYLGDIENLL